MTITTSSMWLVSEKYISKHEIKLWVNNNLSIAKYDNFGLSVTYGFFPSEKIDALLSLC